MPSIHIDFQYPNMRISYKQNARFAHFDRQTANRKANSQ